MVMVLNRRHNNFETRKLVLGGVPPGIVLELEGKKFLSGAWTETRKQHLGLLRRTKKTARQRAAFRSLQRSELWGGVTTWLTSLQQQSASDSHATWGTWR